MANPLARAIMGNNLDRNNKDTLQNRTRNRTPNSETKVNVDEDLTQLINGLIKGDRKVVEKRASVDNKITLEEAANRVKKGL